MLNADLLDNNNFSETKPNNKELLKINAIISVILILL